MILKQNDGRRKQTRNVALGMRAMSERRVMEMSYNLTKCGHKRNKLAAYKLYLNLTLSKILGLFCWSLLPGHRDTSKPAPTSHLLPQLLTSLPRSTPLRCDSVTIPHCPVFMGVLP